jgi:hypothetical protein
VTGATADINELGLYAINVQQYRKNMDLSKSAGTISFDLWNEVEFNTKKSCETCRSTDEIIVPNIAFLTLLSLVQNEGALMLQATCSTTQIALISNPQNFPYCQTSEMGTTTVCVCCAPTPTVNASTCSALTAKTTKIGGLLSYLAKYDNGIQLDAVPSSTFLLSTGTYTPLIRRMSVLELTFGSISAYVGMFKTARALRDNDWETVYEIGNTTVDLRDACVLNCPTVAEVVALFPSQFLGAFQNVECVGTVPSADVLVSQGNLTQERADQLRYLEGVSCRSFGVNIATSAVIQATSPTAINVCSDGSSTLPCCLLSSTSPLVTAKGIGCQFYVSGLVQSKRVFNEEQALQLPTGTKFYSGCAPGRKKFQQISWKGEDHYDEWFTPSTYSYPKMPWADPTVMRKGKDRAIAGTMSIFNISGFQVSVRQGRGITSNFLDYDLTDGDPKYDEEEIWSSFKLRTLNISYQKRSEVFGIETNHFLSNIGNATTTAEKEAVQRSGQMPYENLENLVYASDGVPVIMSLPTWYGSNPRMLSQTSNAGVGSTSTVGVNVYRTYESYDRQAKPYATPQLVTEQTWDTFGEKEYRGKVDIEPATGLTLKGQIANQFSVFTWNCNPQLDSSCALQATAQSPTAPLCYLDGTRQYPCSAANIFTPAVMGSKVLPVYILTTDPSAPDSAVNNLHFGITARYAFSILVIIIPILSFIIGGYLSYRLYHLIQEENAAHAAGAGDNDAVLSTAYAGDLMK